MLVAITFNLVVIIFSIGFTQSLKLLNHNSIINHASIQKNRRVITESLLANSNYNQNKRIPFRLYYQQSELIGEDAALFKLEEQKLTAWAQFFVAVSGVLGSLFYVWIYEAGV